jgi:L-gulonolactone oxidase
MSNLSLLSTRSLHEALRGVPVVTSSPRAAFANWAKTYACHPLVFFEPRNVEECALIFELARREGKTVRPVGVGHSPSDLACTDEYMLRTTKLDKILEVSFFLFRLTLPILSPVVSFHPFRSFFLLFDLSLHRASPSDG